MAEKKEYFHWIEEAMNYMPVLKNKCAIMDTQGRKWYMELAEVDV